jgi:hypothetical protein
LTEDLPTIKAYDETLWAKLGDVEDTPIETSLQLLECLHQRWVVLLNSLSDEDLKRGYLHPEFLAHADSVLSNDEVREILKSGDFNGIPDYVMPLGRVMGLYAWHGKHHVAHITTLRDRLGW